MVKPAAHIRTAWGQTAPGLIQMSLENLQGHQDCSFHEEPHLKLDYFHDREVRASLISTYVFFHVFLPYTTVKISSCRNCPCHRPNPGVTCSQHSQLSLSPHRSSESNPDHHSGPSLDLLLFSLIFFCIEEVLFSVIKS